MNFAYSIVCKNILSLGDTSLATTLATRTNVQKQNPSHINFGKIKMQKFLNLAPTCPTVTVQSKQLLLCGTAKRQLLQRTTEKRPFLPLVTSFSGIVQSSISPTNVLSSYPFTQVRDVARSPFSSKKIAKNEDASRAKFFSGWVFRCILASL